MASPPYMSSRSPPPLQHPKPTHPAYPPPEPPQTPGRSSTSSYGRTSLDMGDGYVRYSSPPVGSIHQQTEGHGHGQHHAPSASTSAYAPPQGEMHSRGYGQQPHAPMGYGQSAGFGWPVNDATAQMGVQFGKSAVAAGQDYVEKNFSRYLPLPLVKTCFAVTNGYVLRKLRIVLFPWRHRPWARQPRRTGDGGAGVEAWQPPRDDINAPDLYIPTMAVVTYTLLSALAAGLGQRFHPEVLGYAASKAMAVILIEFFAIKLGCYFLDVRGGGASGVELLAYGGYKFVGIIVTVLASLLSFGRVATGTVFLYVSCANAFFLLRSLKYVLLPDSSVSASAATLSHGQRSRRVLFLFIVAASQVVSMALLSWV